FYRLLFKGENNNIYFLLLIWMILGTFFSSFTSFMQVLIDKNEFMVSQDKMFASVNNVNTSLVYLSIILIVLVVLYYIHFHCDCFNRSADIPWTDCCECGALIYENVSTCLYHYSLCIDKYYSDCRWAVHRRKGICIRNNDYCDYQLCWWHIFYLLIIKG